MAWRIIGMEDNWHGGQLAWRTIGMEDNWHGGQLACRTIGIDFLNYYGVSYLITLFICSFKGN